jgi:hypothetical protein
VLRQGHVAVNSILRDWVKGQMTAVECGILSFEAVHVHPRRPAAELSASSSCCWKAKDDKLWHCQRLDVCCDGASHSE